MTTYASKFERSITVASFIMHVFSQVFFYGKTWLNTDSQVWYIKFKSSSLTLTCWSDWHWLNIGWWHVFNHRLHDQIQIYSFLNDRSEILPCSFDDCRTALNAGKFVNNVVVVVVVVEHLYISYLEGMYARYVLYSITLLYLFILKSLFSTLYIKILHIQTKLLKPSCMLLSIESHKVHNR